jgi:hypothetical protein
VRAPVRFAFGEPHGLLSSTPSSEPRKVIGKHATNLLPTFSEIAWGAARKSGFVFLSHGFRIKVRSNVLWGDGSTNLEAETQQ